MFYKFLNNKLEEELKKSRLILNNQKNQFMTSFIISDFKKEEKNIVVVMPSLFEAQRCYDDLAEALGDSVLFFPADELVAVELLDIQGDFKYERINTITSIIKNERPYIVVTNINGAIRKELNPETLKKYFLKLKKNDSINEEELFNKFEAMGYKFSYTVTKTGEYSHRGSIIDIFPLNYDNPIRLDMFGDDIDDIRTFDFDSQKSIDHIDEFEIIPVTEFIIKNDELSVVQDRIKEFTKKFKLSDDEIKRYDTDINNIGIRKGLDNMLRYINMIEASPTTIIDMMSSPKLYLINDERTKASFDHMVLDLNNYCEDIGGYSLLNLDYFKDYYYVYNMASVISEGVVDTNLPGVDYEITIPEAMLGKREDILKFINKNINKYIIVVAVKNTYRLDHLKDDILELGIHFDEIKSKDSFKSGQINIVSAHIPSFKSDALGIIVLNEGTLFDNKEERRKPKYKSIYKNTQKISRYDELSVGDYVVHFDHGIGRYCGLEAVEFGGIKRDNIKIEYSNNDVLYIPLEQINQIEKYTPTSDTVTLSSLGTKSWSLAKERARKRIQDISKNLIRLYARRQAAVGFEFEPDTEEQVEFEADFGYELTVDQEKAIVEIKKEMESPRVMDRLVCGDVGYGKTEVALRAAFKAVMSGRQVAVLAPTTILARQHFYTFKNRMERYGVRVDLVTRLQSIKHITASKKALKSGECDVVIGTHKLLSKEIEYKSLGLLVIDEEQRFGVVQKERIKELKVNVDTLTLSATPIPRTLQMSMLGIKSLSMLETPPKNRYPIQTYVLERNDSIIRDAIMREIARGGQVFYMFNNTERIEFIASHIQSLCPDARICIGHGKMDKNELENIITSFIDKEYDVLICTTIIETGIDMPDANTLIVHNANILGLSQLYQLRGRVGRSDKIAYAYLMYDPGTILTEIATKRLEAIKEFNELGSGFKIAMKDLAIRGAGDILGDSQSGFIETVGLETYLHILDEEIKNLTEPVKLETPKVLDPSIKKVYASRTISSNYINNEDVKIEIHKKIDKIDTIEDLEKISLELKDRFGIYDNEIEVYMYEKLMNKLCLRLDMKKILDTKSQMILFMSEEMSNKMNGNKMFDLANESSSALSLHYYNKQIEIIVDKMKFKDNEHIVTLTKYLVKLEESYKNNWL